PGDIDRRHFHPPDVQRLAFHRLITDRLTIGSREHPLPAFDVSLDSTAWPRSEIENDQLAILTVVRCLRQRELRLAHRTRNLHLLPGRRCRELQAAAGRRRSRRLYTVMRRMPRWSSAALARLRGSHPRVTGRQARRRGRRTTLFIKQGRQ